MSYEFIVLREKIKRNQIEKEVEKYLCKIKKRNPNISNLEDEENVCIMREELWSDYIKIIDSLCDGYGPREEYIF